MRWCCRGRAKREKKISCEVAPDDTCYEFISGNHKAQLSVTLVLNMNGFVLYGQQIRFMIIAQSFTPTQSISFYHFQILFDIDHYLFERIKIRTVSFNPETEAPRQNKSHGGNISARSATIK